MIIIIFTIDICTYVRYTSLNIWTYVHNIKDSMCNPEEERSDEILAKIILKSASNLVEYAIINSKK